MTSVLLLLSASVLGAFLSAATFGARIPAGVILPSMTVGAALGRATGMLVQQWHRSYPQAWIFSSCTSETDCVTPGVYAIIGASAALSGVTRMTVSLVVIMFELTGALTYVLPIMISVLVSKFVADAFEKRGIYESWIALQNYPYLDKADDSFYGVTIKNLMTPFEELSVIEEAESNTVATMNDLLVSHPYTGYPVIDNRTDRILLGFICSNELRQALIQAGSLSESTPIYFGNDSTAPVSGSLNLRPYLDSTPFMLAAESNVRLIVNLFQRLGVRYVFFGRRGQLKGMITRKGLLRTIDSFIHAPTFNDDEALLENGHAQRNGILKLSRTTPRVPSSVF